MPISVIMRDSDLPFSHRLKLRENALAWISRDGGLHSFFFPTNELTQLTLRQQNEYVVSVVHNYLFASSDIGERSYNRAVIRDNVASLRRCVVKLRGNTITYREVAQYCLLLELLWDDVSSNLSDIIWVKCSLHFDTSLIALRIVYLCLYLREEYPTPEYVVKVRAAAFGSLVHEMFINGSLLDAEKYDKHSTNFKDLLSAWGTEFMTFVRSASFEEKITDLEALQGMKEAADLIDGFLRESWVDESWVLRANQLTEDMDNGRLTRRISRKPGSKNAPASLSEELSDVPASDKCEAEPESKAKDDDVNPADVIDVDGAEHDIDSDNDSTSPSHPRSRSNRASGISPSPRRKPPIHQRLARHSPVRGQRSEGQATSPLNAADIHDHGDLSGAGNDVDMSAVARDPGPPGRKRKRLYNQEQSPSASEKHDDLSYKSRRGVRQVPSVDQEDYRVHDHSTSSRDKRRKLFLKAMSEAEVNIHREAESEIVVLSD